MNSSAENVQASILDKLIDFEPENSQEPVTVRMQSLRDIEASVVRDIENLLNTRRTIHPPPSTLHEVSNSLYMYGLRDFTNENPNSAQVLQKLRREIAQALTLFEPRLKNVVVHAEVKDNTRRDLHFRIAGTLVVKPLAEPIIFDIRVDHNKGEYLVAR